MGMKSVLVIFALLHTVLSVENGAEQASDESDVSKRSRNPYSWMNTKKSDELRRWIPSRDDFGSFDAEELGKRARNPYSWLNYKEKRALRNPYSWMAYGDKRAPLNPYSWMYTLEKRMRPALNPYSWQNQPEEW